MHAVEPSTRPTELGDYGVMIRRQWWVIALAVCVGLLAAAGYTASQHRVYTSTTQVLVTAIGATNTTDTANARTRGAINLDTEAQLLKSTAVVTLVKNKLGFSGSVIQLARHVKVTVPPNTEVLTIAFDGDTPANAQLGATAFASAYLANRAQSARDDVDAEQIARRNLIESLGTSLEDARARQASLPAGSAERTVAVAQGQSLSEQIALLTSENAQLSDSTLNPGRTISDATLPDGPSSPVLVVNLAGGAMLGLLLGLAVGLLRHRADRRPRTAEELARLTGVPALVTVSAGTLDVGESSSGLLGRGYVRLRNAVTTMSAAQTQVILVAGVDRDASDVATNLAVSLAGTGVDVALLRTYLAATDDPLGLDRVAGGLPDVLEGTLVCAAALQQPSGVGGLRVLAAGGDPDRTARLMQTHAANTVLQELRRDFRYVIVDAPSTASSGQAQTMAVLADAVLVVVTARRTQAEAVIDAAAQFAAVGARVIGGVLLEGAQKPPKVKRAKVIAKAAVGDAPAEADPPVSAGQATPSPQPPRAEVSGAGAKPAPASRRWRPTARTSR